MTKTNNGKTSKKADELVDGTGEAKRLARLTARTKTVSAGLATFGLLDPGAAPEGSPTGQVTLGEKSGALAPMLAFDVLNAAAEDVAGKAANVEVARTANPLGEHGALDDPLDHEHRTAPDDGSHDDQPSPVTIQRSDEDDGEDDGDDEGDDELVLEHDLNLREQHDSAGQIPDPVAQQPVAAQAPAPAPDQAAGTNTGDALPGQPLPTAAQPSPGVVLVTEDPALLRSDLLSQQVRTVLTQWQLALDVEHTVNAAADKFVESTRRRNLLDNDPTTPTPTPDPTLTTQTPTGDAETDDKKEEEAGSAAEAAIASVGVVLRDLAQLAAVDFTLTAVAVSPAAGLLARLTAGHLANKDKTRPVVLDGFGRIDPQSPTMTLFNDVQTMVRGARAHVANLERLIAGRKAAVTALQAEADLLAKQWAAAVADKDVQADRADKLEAALNDRRSSIATKSVGLAPAQTVVDYVAALIAAAQNDLEALVTADTVGTSMLLRACSREALHAAKDDRGRVVRVLCVEAPHLGADVVTRHSVLGSSGRVGFLGAASVAWVLLDADTGHIIGGGGQPKAAQLTYDLDKADTNRTDVNVNGTTLGDDPLRTIENGMRLAIMVTAFAVLLLGLAAIGGMIHLWLPDN